MKSSKAEAVILVEAQSLEALRASRVSRAKASSAVEDAENSREDVAKQLMILKMELQNRDKVADVEAANVAAHDATASAKQAAAELREKARQAANASKAAAKAQELLTSSMLRDKKESAAGDRRGEDARRKTALRDELLELKQIEKMRNDRDKARHCALKRSLLMKRCQMAQIQNAD